MVKGCYFLQGGKCGPNCTLVVNTPVGVSVKETLQQTTVPSLGTTASLSLDANLFAIDPAITKQKSTTVKRIINLHTSFIMFCCVVIG